MTDPHGHDDHPHPHHGWRKVWRVARIALVTAATLVVGANLVRCYVVPAAAATASDGAGVNAEPEVAPGALPRALSIEEAKAAGVGLRVSCGWTDPAGASRTLKEVSGHGATVVAMSSTSCPLSRKWAATLGDLARAYADRQVRFVVVYPGDDDEPSVTAQLKSAGLEGSNVTVVRGGRAVARSLGGQTTTERFVLDGSGTLVYRGATDDQFGLGVARESPRARWVVDALEAVLAGRTPSVSATTSPGCALDLAASPSAQITWSDSVAKIVYARCVSCHRDGGAGPFPLQTYQQVRQHAPMIKRVVSKGIMPPWLAAQPQDGSPSPWANDKSLDPVQKQTLLAWIESGAEPGDLATAPKPPVFAGEWSIGAPDAVFELPEPVAVRATGVMPYVDIYVPTGFAEDRWVSAVEVLPTARQAVHHVLVFAVDGDNAGKRPLRERAERAREGGGFFAAYVPGGEPAVFPDGFAKKLPAGSSLHFQLHYTPTGEATSDRTRIGLRFATKPPRHEVKVVGIVQPRLNIPAGDPDYTATASIPVPADAVVTALMPHMHLRGRSFDYVWQKPDGSRQQLLSVPRWDFNWQMPYRLKDPLLLPRGSKVIATAHYDNSADNPANPDPTRNVRWGQQSTDEMMIGYVEYYLK